jgi:hypothetical protein
MTLCIKHCGLMLCTIAGFPDASVGEREVNLGAAYARDTVLDVCEALARAAAPRGRQTLVKYHDMVGMRRVCDAIGISFDRFVRPHYRTLGALECCEFAIRRYGASGSLRFEAGCAHLNLRTERFLVNKSFDYAVDDGVIKLRAQIFTKLLLHENGRDLVLVRGAGEPAIEILHNTTPERLAEAVPPAVPAYRDASINEK